MLSLRLEIGQRKTRSLPLRIYCPYTQQSSRRTGGNSCRLRPPECIATRVRPMSSRAFSTSGMIDARVILASLEMRRWSRNYETAAVGCKRPLLCCCIHASYAKRSSRTKTCCANIWMLYTEVSDGTKLLCTATFPYPLTSPHLPRKGARCAALPLHTNTARPTPATPSTKPPHLIPVPVRLAAFWPADFAQCSTGQKR